MYKKIFYLIVRIKLILPKMLYKLPFPQNILHKNPYVYAKELLSNHLY